MKITLTSFLRRVGALALVLAGGLAVAQPEPADPPGRVGRLSDVSGQVWLLAPDAGEWVSASRNRPFTGGERLATDSGARAEVRIGSMTVRLDGGTELEAIRIDDDRVELQLHSGSLGARFGSRETVREFELRTGEGNFRVNRTGRYRFDRRDETSQLTVYGGEAVYEGPRSALTVYSGQRAEFWIDGAGVAQYAITDPLRDDFAGWNRERDRADERSASARYVSPEMTGVEDLDRYGRWQQDADNGPVWVPSEVSPGWAPYSTGHWAWVAPWGWTWVDDAPWGFAPFHYGRWVMLNNVWCWAPGRRVVRPVYAPALVGWIGGPQVGLSISIGTGPMVGWVPLAPREVYVPTYHVSPRYVRDVNITHVTNITNIINQVPSGRGALVNNPPQDRGHPEFRNRRIPGAVTVVPASVMTERRPVAPAAAEIVKTGSGREFINNPSRGIPLVAPPVAAPVATVRETSRPVSPGPAVTPRGDVRAAPPVPQGRGDDGAPRGRERPAVERVNKFEREAPVAPVRPRIDRNDPPEPQVRSAPPPERRVREADESPRAAPPVPQVQPRARPPQPEREDPPVPVLRRPERPVETAPPVRAPEPRPVEPRAPQPPRMVEPPRVEPPRPQVMPQRPVEAPRPQVQDRQDDRRERELILRGKDKDR